MSNRWETVRTEIFSDGVFAIAITLLVLDIRVPESAFDDLWRGIADEWPAYLAYATSFITIGAVWLAHHSVFQRLGRVDDRLMRLNLLLLMAVAFLPFPTRLLAEAIQTDASRVAVIFHGAWLLLISLLLTSMGAAIARRPELLKVGVSQQQVKALMRAVAPNLGFYAVVILLAIAAPEVAAFGYLLVAIVIVLRVRDDEETPSKAEAAA